MDREPSDGERGEPEVRAQLEKIRRDQRGRVRWKLSRHTAEMALVAISDTPRRDYRRSAKSRRRKRYKRLL